jgi:hypothetical protein
MPLSKKQKYLKYRQAGSDHDEAAHRAGIKNKDVKYQYGRAWELLAEPANLLDRDVTDLTPAERVEYDRQMIAAGWKPARSRFPGSVTGGYIRRPDFQQRGSYRNSLP